VNGDSYSIELKVKADPEEARGIDAGLKQFNDQFSEDDNHLELAVVLRDGQGQLAGGLLADTGWRWLHVNTLWIRADMRGQGYGRRLLEMAEQEAIRRGCRHAQLETHDFQALGFYQKQGYGLFGQLDDYPPDHIKYFLKKEL
jgi:ribosomal protein S18 acetylase RimI-like enzyme